MRGDEEDPNQRGMQLEPPLGIAAAPEEPEFNQGEAAQRDDAEQIEADRDDIGRATNPARDTNHRNH